MSFGVIAGVGGLALSAYGAYDAHQQAGNMQSAQNRALAAARTNLNGFRTFGLGNTGATYWNNPDGQGGQIALNAGNLAGPLGNLQNFAAYAPRSPSGMPEDIASAMNYVQRLAGQPVPTGLPIPRGTPINIMDSGLASLESRLGSVASRAMGDMGRTDPGLASIGSQAGRLGDTALNDLLSNMRNGFQRPLQNTAFRGAGAQLNEAMMGGDAARDRHLQLLRQQAQPFEQRAFNTLQNDLFSTGRSGTSGGGLQMEAFARGLGQVDLDRQLAAAGEGRAFQQNAMGLASGAAGLGMGLQGQEMDRTNVLGNLFGNMGGMGMQARGMQDDLLNNAFGRFRDATAMNADINNQRFQRSMYANEADYQRALTANQLGYDRAMTANNMRYSRAQDVLGSLTGLSGLPMQLDAARLANVGAALQGQAGIQEQLMQLFGGGLQAEQAAANARIGSGSNMAAIAGNPNFGMGGMMQAGTWSQLGGALMGGQSASDILGRIFAPQPTGGMPGNVGSGVLLNQPGYGDAAMRMIRGY